ncbi:MAG TPA: DPP IV N-terminal domain-containing protein, partial [Candidatus Acidoferrales bacterium]|nr:DPP IV N-terminal domain-containing protein [Candidatus Acidoferrales bacterium]
DSPAPYRVSTGRLAFDTDISILDSDGGEPLEQSLGPGFIPQAAWLPDGRSVAVDFRPAPRRAWDKTGIYAMELDRNDPPPLLIRDAYHFAWSPDGKSVAYVASRGKKNHPAIFVALADGSGEHRLTDPELKADDPAWSPDAKRLALAVEHGTHGTTQGLYVMDADGSELRNLSGKKDHVQSPAWSPDGKRMAFLVGKNWDTQLFVVNADGSDLRQLTNEKKLYCRKPTWSPDSAEIAFECGPHFSEYYYYDPFWWEPGPRVPETDIYLLRLDAPDAKPVQISRGGGSNPAFCPAPFTRDAAGTR